jgi:hypothetical protein
MFQFYFQNGMTCAHIAASKGSVAVIKELMRFNKVIVTTARNRVSTCLSNLSQMLSIYIYTTEDWMHQRRKTTTIILTCLALHM